MKRSMVILGLVYVVMWGEKTSKRVSRADTSFKRINKRVTYMVERGLVSEVRSLLEAGYTLDDPGMTATGYREIAQYLEGDQTLEEAMEEIRRNTRHYARRQLTWFRNQLPSSVRIIDATSCIDLQATAVLDAWVEVHEQTGPQIRGDEPSL